MASKTLNLLHVAPGRLPIVNVSAGLTQDRINANPTLKRFQQDLLVLTSMADNSTLHWRPEWFSQLPFSLKFWTLHNPPNVVTEYLPRKSHEPKVTTRRMRLAHDAPPMFIKTWDHWKHYCNMYGVPEDFLCEKQVQLMRMGLEQDARGNLKEPATYPLYPEPQPLNCGRYLLSPLTHRHLPAKFHGIKPEQLLVVHSTGAFSISDWDEFFFHSSQWTHYDGTGAHVDDPWYVPDLEAKIKYQGKGRRWCRIPWTREQERSVMDEVEDEEIKDGASPMDSGFVSGNETGAA